MHLIFVYFLRLLVKEKICMLHSMPKQSNNVEIMCRFICAKTSLCLRLYGRTLKTWHCPHLLLRRRAAAAPAVQQSIDISYPPGPQQQTRRTLLSGWIIQTDGRTSDRFIYPAPHTFRAVPIIGHNTLAYFHRSIDLLKAKGPNGHLYRSKIHDVQWC